MTISLSDEAQIERIELLTELQSSWGQSDYRNHMRIENVMLFDKRSLAENGESTTDDIEILYLGHRMVVNPDGEPLMQLFVRYTTQTDEQVGFGWLTFDSTGSSLEMHDIGELAHSLDDGLVKVIHDGMTLRAIINAKTPSLLHEFGL
jgi:hypothetical protein